LLFLGVFVYFWFVVLGVCVMSGNQMDRNDYSVGASQAVQGNFEAVASELEAALDRRDADVKQAMSAYQADGVFGAIRQSLAENDDVAARALSTARSAIPE